MKVKIITTGGTIDKVYFDAKSSFQIGEPQIGEVLARSNVTVDYEITSLLRKDSLEMTDGDRQLIHDVIANDADCTHFVITHGTDTMAATGRFLFEMAQEQGKTIVMTGSMQPARFRQTDAVFNIGAAVTAAQIMSPGAWIAMNGQIFNPTISAKNVELNRFEST